MCLFRTFLSFGPRTLWWRYWLRLRLCCRLPRSAPKEAAPSRSALRCTACSAAGTPCSPIADMDSLRPTAQTRAFSSVLRDRRSHEVSIRHKIGCIDALSLSSRQYNKIILRRSQQAVHQASHACGASCAARSQRLDSVLEEMGSAASACTMSWLHKTRVIVTESSEMTLHSALPQAVARKLSVHTYLFHHSHRRAQMMRTRTLKIRSPEFRCGSLINLAPASKS